MITQFCKHLRQTITLGWGARLFTIMTTMITAMVIAVAMLSSPRVYGYARTKTDLGVPVAWAEMPIHYGVGRAGSATVSDGSEIQAIHDAFAVWAAVDCAKLSFQFDGLVDFPRVEAGGAGGHNNHIFWIKEPDRWPYPQQVLASTKLTWDAQTGILRDADIAFNDHAFRWSTQTQPPADHYDVKNTAVHEIGHLLGLEHSSVPEATMFAASPAAETQKRDLATDDQEGICAIYPKQGAGGTWVVVSSNEGLQTCQPAANASLPGSEVGVGCQTVSPAAWNPWLWTWFALFCWLLFCGIRGCRIFGKKLAATKFFCG